MIYFLIIIITAIIEIITILSNLPMKKKEDITKLMTRIIHGAIIMFALDLLF